MLALPVFAESPLLSPLPENTTLFGFVSPLAPDQQYAHNPTNVLGTSTISGNSALPILDKPPAVDNEEFPEFLTPSPTTVPEETPTPILNPKPTKSHYTIAVVGDSMVDVLGPGIPTLKNLLQSTYPKTAFTIYNFGVGASNLEFGIKRLTDGYSYLNEDKPSVLSTNPDILILESFAYNNFGPGQSGLDKQWLLLADAVNVIRSNSPNTKIIIAATIAPNAQIFGDGANLGFSAQDKWYKSDTIKKYLENAIKFGESQHLPTVDAYHPSLGKDGWGQTKFIGDGIHPSEAGKSLFFQKILQIIQESQLLDK